MITSYHALINQTFAAVLLATNSLSISGDTTNRDVVTSMTRPVLVIKNYDYSDAVGNYCPVITNSGTYSLNGVSTWGYQVYVTAPGSVRAPCGFAVSSLSNLMVTNLQSLVNAGKSPAEFSTFDLTHTNFIYNPNFWLKNQYQITGMIAAEQPPGMALSSQECGAAISPLHVVVCWHAPYSTGYNLFWEGSDGTLVERQVVAVTTNNLAGTDIEVCLLNSPLPTTVIPLPLLPTNYISWMPALTNTALVPVVCGNQQKSITPKTVNSVTTGDGSYIANQYWFPPAWGVPVTGGDSGCPICMAVGTNLVLVSHWHYSTGGPWYPNYESQINQAMHFLSTNNAVGSDYQLSTVDLSPYPTF